jgi:hypothetical protein
MTTYIQIATPTIEAEQWLGTDESLRKIQALIFPASPLLGRKANEVDRFGHLPGHPTLGVMIDKSDVIPHQLAHLTVGGWAVKYPNGRITTMTDEEFRAVFAPADVGGYESNFAETLRDA